MTAEDRVCKAGDKANKLYFVGNGMIELQNEDGKSVRSITLSPDPEYGIFLNQIDFVLRRNCQISVKLVTKSVVSWITYEDFQKV